LLVDVEIAEARDDGLDRRMITDGCQFGGVRRVRRANGNDFAVRPSLRDDPFDDVAHIADFIARPRRRPAPERCARAAHVRIDDCETVIDPVTVSAGRLTPFRGAPVTGLR